MPYKSIAKINIRLIDIKVIININYTYILPLKLLKLPKFDCT